MKDSMPLETFSFSLACTLFLSLSLHHLCRRTSQAILGSLGCVSEPFLQCFQMGHLVIRTGRFEELKSVWAGQKASTVCRRSSCGLRLRAGCVGLGTLLESAAVNKLDPCSNTGLCDAGQPAGIWTNKKPAEEGLILAFSTQLAVQNHTHTSDKHTHTSQTDTQTAQHLSHSYIV